MTTPVGVNGSYYLWVRAVDNSGNETITRSDAFNLDNTIPVITHPGTTSLFPIDVASFNPYAGVKTSILLFDNEVSRNTDEILFVKI